MIPHVLLGLHAMVKKHLRTCTYVYVCVCVIGITRNMHARHALRGTTTPLVSLGGVPNVVYSVAERDTARSLSQSSENIVDHLKCHFSSVTMLRHSTSRIILF